VRDTPTGLVNCQVTERKKRGDVFRGWARIAALGAAGGKPGRRRVAYSQPRLMMNAASIDTLSIGWKLRFRAVTDVEEHVAAARVDGRVEAAVEVGIAARRARRRVEALAIGGGEQRVAADELVVCCP